MHRTSLAQQIHHGEGVDRFLLSRLGDLDDDEELGPGVVDDPEPDPHIRQRCGHVQVGRGGLEDAVGVVVEHHLPRLERSRQRQYALRCPPRQHAHGRDHTVAIDLGSEVDLTPAGGVDLAGQVGGDGGGEARVGHPEY